MCSLTTAPSRAHARANAHPEPRGAALACVLTRGFALGLAMGVMTTLSACEPSAVGDDAAELPDVEAIDGGTTTGDADTTVDAGGAIDAAVADIGPVPDAGPGASLVTGDYEVLFVGNSYVFTGDVPSRVRALAAPRTTRIESIAYGGYRLSQHATDAETDGTALAPWLRTGTPAERAFDVVILQEQSQIGGFPESDATRVESLEGASRLASLARANDASVVLYLTWGRERGDETNPGLFGTFEAMQDRLDAGYRAMAARLRSEGARVRIAPVGAAFRVVHDDLVAAGSDPAAAGSPFDALYSPDGSHPSANGAYLIAVVIHATVTGEDPTTLSDAPDLDAPTSSALREVAARVMRDPDWSSELSD